MQAGPSTEASERAFYDRQAAAAPRTAPRPPDAYERAMLAKAGAVSGIDIVDLGSGAGDLTLELLRRGARVTAVDLSPGQVGLASDRARRFCPDGSARFVTAPAEATGLPSASFDLVIGKWVLHHVDTRRAVDEVHRLLRPGGRGIFYENQARNRPLAFARNRLAGRGVIRVVGTATEHPLLESDFAHMADRFDAVRISHPFFYCFESLGRNVLHNRGLAGLGRLDALLWRRFPRLRPYSWHVLIELRKDYK